MEYNDIVERLGAARARIEAAAHGPSVLVVTSALATDGSAVLASGLADSLSRAGHSVLLVRNETPDGSRRGDRDSSAALQGDSAMQLPGATSRSVATVGLSMTGSRDVYSLESIRAALANYRERFAFTIIDAPQALASGTALSFAGAADLIVVAFEDGRAGRPVDRELAKTLAAVGASVLGVITIDPKTLASLAKKPVVAKSPRIGTSLADDAARRKSVLSSMIG